jgi:sulfur carrier protein
MITVNGSPWHETGLTVDQLLDAMGVVPRGVAVAVDGEVVRRADWALRRIEDGAVVEIVTAAAGG